MAVLCVPRRGRLSTLVGGRETQPSRTTPSPARPGRPPRHTRAGVGDPQVPLPVIAPARREPLGVEAAGSTVAGHFPALARQLTSQAWERNNLMPATPRTARACALALAGLGLTASTTERHARTAATGGGTSDTPPPRPAKKLADGAPAQGQATGCSAPATSPCASAATRTPTAPPARTASTAPAWSTTATPRRLLACRVRRARRPASPAASPRSDMRAGDLMFFYGSGGVYHAAIFLRWSHGHAVMVHSPGLGPARPRRRPVDVRAGSAGHRRA